MKQILFIIGLLFVLSSCQSSKLTTKQVERKNYLEVIGSDTPDMIKADKYAMYPNGMNGVLQDITDNLSYPQNAAIYGIQGAVIVEIIVETDGHIKHAKVLKSVNPDLDAEAIRVVKSLKTWIPGYKDGKPARVSYKIPINFSLR